LCAQAAAPFIGNDVAPCRCKSKAGVVEGKARQPADQGRGNMTDPAIDMRSGDQKLKKDEAE